MYTVNIRAYESAGIDGAGCLAINIPFTGASKVEFEYYDPGAEEIDDNYYDAYFDIHTGATQNGGTEIHTSNYGSGLSKAKMEKCPSSPGHFAYEIDTNTGWHTIKIIYEGTTYSGYRDDVEIFSITNTSTPMDALEFSVYGYVSSSGITYSLSVRNLKADDVEVDMSSVTPFVQDAHMLYTVSGGPSGAATPVYIILKEI